MKRVPFFGDAGLGRNPKVGEPVVFDQSPDILGRVVEQKLGSNGAYIWRVQWHSGPVKESWHPAEGLRLAENVQ